LQCGRPSQKGPGPQKKTLAPVSTDSSKVPGQEAIRTGEASDIKFVPIGEISFLFLDGKKNGFYFPGRREYLLFHLLILLAYTSNR